uniref:Cell division cycle protein 27 homolog n=1 Tax=Syphacia muris TaxID=451379 RepID=A0A0N5AWB8_9BILA
MVHIHVYLEKNVDNCMFKGLIYYYLEFFAFEDAALLAELYHEQVRSSESLYVYGQCLLQSGQVEAACRLLAVDSLQTPQLRYLYAHCCYDLKRSERYSPRILIQEAESALRMDEASRLHPIFEDTPVEPFAHALLAKILLESGRTNEAIVENRLAMEKNKLSWSVMKLHCDIGVASEVEDLCTQLVRHTSEAKEICRRKNTTLPLSQDFVPLGRSPEKRTPVMRDAKDIIDEKLLCLGPKKPRTSVVGKRNSDSMGVRRLMEGGVETRRSSRLLQDSENLATSGGDVRKTSRLKLTSTMGSGLRTFTDKQLRSVNRLSEEEMNRLTVKKSPSPQSSPPLEKVLETHDIIPVTSNKVKPLQMSKEDTLTVSLLPTSPSSNHMEEEHISIVSSDKPKLQGLVGSGTSRRFPSSMNLLNEPSKWTPLLIDIVQTVASLARVQSFLSRYSTSSALESFESMPEACSTSALGRELLARIYLEMLDYSKTREILERLHIDFPHRLSGMEVLSTALWHEQDSRRLSMLAAELTENARTFAETWCAAGNCFSVQKQHETAIECFERAVILKPHFAYAYSLLGHELLDTDQLDKAASSFRRALCLCPTDYRAWFGLGLLHFKREQLAWARFYLRRAVKINPYNSVLLCQLSVVEQSLHNNPSAMNLLDRALEIAPDNAACRFYRARLLYEMRDYDTCRAALNDLKLFAHDEAQVFFLLGRVYKKLNNTHLALLNFSWAAEMDPRGEQNQATRSECAYDDDPGSPGGR